ncbi:hypothetical protein Q5P01_004471 [Channa striata]|uniref:Ig-like domain-containing protein n=1 Tax=Channa striata TaxID=64152 RepID=A0AA88NPA9_CHASR|nr:hypothetical protein Q5P01_004471 [Channa striata]
MDVLKSRLVLLVLNFLWTPTRGEMEVSCVFMKSCSLPCSFNVGGEEIIHWILFPENLPVHSYYHGQDQLAYQDPRFSGRTSLLKDLISRGEASLQLSGVRVQDQGRYKCYTSTTSGKKETIISLKVDAPVRKIHIDQTEQQLYNISSSLILSDPVPDVTYSCRISTRTNTRTTTSVKPTSIIWSNNETLPCAEVSEPITGFVWRFKRRRLIVEVSGGTRHVSEEWRPLMKEVSDRGELTLQQLTPEQEGIYTCEVSTAEETRVSSIFLRIEKQQDTSHSLTIGLVVGGVLAVIVIVTVISVLSFVFKDKLPCRKRKTGESEVL